jgi:hypothetical protein
MPGEIEGGADVGCNARSTLVRAVEGYRRTLRAP